MCLQPCCAGAARGRRLAHGIWSEVGGEARTSSGSRPLPTSWKGEGVGHVSQEPSHSTGSRSFGLRRVLDVRCLKSLLDLGKRQVCAGKGAFLTETEKMRDAELTDRDIWTTAVIVSVVLAAIGLLVASMTVVDIFQGRIPARTIWGVMVVVTGFLSPVFTGLVVVCKPHFARSQRSRQDIWIYAIASGYLLVLAILMFRGSYSSTIVLPLPFMPTLSIGLDDNGMLELDLERDSHGWSGGTLIPAPIGEHALPFEGDWSAPRHPGLSWSILQLLPRKYRPPYHPGPTIAELTGTIASRGAEGISIAMDLTVTETIELNVNGLDDVDIACGELDTFDPAHIEPGRYRIAITGRHKKLPTESDP